MAVQKKVLGTHGLMKRYPLEQTAERMAEQRARREMDRLNDYLMRNWSSQMNDLGLAGVPLVMALLDEFDTLLTEKEAA